MQQEGASKTEKRVSIDSKDATNIQPVLYSFRAVGGGFRSGNVMTAIRPPYWLYHDHALGVVWSLFNKEKNYVGITQLHWCLRFLLDLKNSQGEYTGDVEVCIRLIQDDLIEQYAKLGETINESMEQTSLGLSQSETKKPDDETIQSPIRETTSGSKNALLEDNDVSAPAPDEQPMMSSTVKNSIDLTTGQGQHGEFSQTDKKDLRSSIADSRKSGEKSEAQHSKKNCDQAKCGTSDSNEKKKKEAVSFVYNEMISRGPAPCKEGESIADLMDERGYFEASHHQTSDYEIHVDRPEVASSREMVNFLNSSRQQHIERIKREIERLHGLEKFMENLNASGFTAYVTEDLAKRMESLRDEDFIKEAGEITMRK